VGSNVLHSDAVLHLREHERSTITHALRVAGHDIQVRSHGRRKVSFVNDQQISLRDAWATFPRDFVTASDINDVDNEISKLATEIGSQIVTSTFDQQQLCLMLPCQLLQRAKINTDVLADGGMRAAASLDSTDAAGVKRSMSEQEFAILLRENVIRHCAEAVLVTQAAAQGEHERRLASPYRAPDAHSEAPASVVARKRLRASGELARTGQHLVRVRRQAVMAVRVTSVCVTGSNNHSATMTVTVPGAVAVRMLVPVALTVLISLLLAACVPADRLLLASCSLVVLANH